MEWLIYLACLILYAKDKILVKVRGSADTIFWEYAKHFPANISSVKVIDIANQYEAL